MPDDSYPYWGVYSDLFGGDENMVPGTVLNACVTSAYLTLLPSISSNDSISFYDELSIWFESLTDDEREAFYILPEETLDGYL